MTPNLSRILFSIFFIVFFIITGCSKEEQAGIELNPTLLSSEPHGVYYEIFVRSFADSNADGIGDIKGATDKLDYLADLGIEGIWLMPISPPPTIMAMM